MADRVRITDVSPRDGLQNEPGVIPTAEKVRLVELLCVTGVDEVEVTSFVSPKWVPQLGDGAEVLRQFAATNAEAAAERPLFSALVPNERGMEGLLAANASAGRALVGRVCLFTSASEAFSRKNTNASIAESIARFGPVLRAAYAHGLGLKMYVSCAFGCPFQGEVPAESVAFTVGQCLAAADDGRLRAEMPDAHGFRDVEISLGDTIGVATPASIAQVLSVCGPNSPAASGAASAWRRASLNLHLHDTFGRATDCVRAGLAMGVRSFDGSVAGLGGCPYASTPGKRAPGNISTEALAQTVHEAGFATGVSMDRLAHAAAYARSMVARSRAAAAGGDA